MTQRQEFKVLRSYKDFEVREYMPCVLAQVKVSATNSQAGSSAFASHMQKLKNFAKALQKQKFHSLAKRGYADLIRHLNLASCNTTKSLFQPTYNHASTLNFAEVSN